MVHLGLGDYSLSRVSRKRGQDHFISADPNIFHPDTLQDFNRYSYVHNNPLSFTDPSGFDSEDDVDLSNTGGNDRSGWDGVYCPILDLGTDSGMFSNQATGNVYVAGVDGGEYSQVSVAQVTSIDNVQVSQLEDLPEGDIPRAPSKNKIYKSRQDDFWGDLGDVAWDEAQRAAQAYPIDSVVVGTALKVEAVAVEVEAVAVKELPLVVEELQQVTAYVAKGGETAATIAGRAAHKAYELTLGGEYRFNMQLPSGKRPDAIDWVNNIVRELKPDSSSGIYRGVKQLQGYVDELESVTGQKWQGFLDLYKRQP